MELTVLKDSKRLTMKRPNAFTAPDNIYYPSKIKTYSFIKSKPLTVNEYSKSPDFSDPMNGPSIAV